VINRNNAMFVSREAYRLRQLDKTAVGRKYRRFLNDVCLSGGIIQSLAYDEGYSTEQLNALEAYATEMDKLQRYCIPEGVVAPQGIIRDDGFGIVSVVFHLVNDLETATVAQMKDILGVVETLACEMHQFAASGGTCALTDCMPYEYRGLPISIAREGQLWEVGGTDKFTGGSGVLEWCYDKEDAEAILAKMQQFPSRFLNVHASASDAYTRPYVEEAVCA
jgi:hypothetical protein